MLCPSTAVKCREQADSEIRPWDRGRQELWGREEWGVTGSLFGVTDAQHGD